jgi:hypothetical protein
MSIVYNFNSFLSKCKSSFRLVVIEMDEEWVKKLSSFSKDSGDCHPVGKDDIKHAVVALEKESDEIASYVSFSVLTGSLSKMDDMKSFVKDYIETHGDVYINSIILQFSCTHPKYRRRGLSILLRLLIIAFAIKDGYDSVLSATNENSGVLLRDKFGFEVKEEDDMDYLNSYFIPELYLSNGILINAKLVLKSQYLEKYWNIYSKLENCSYK